MVDRATLSSHTAEVSSIWTTVRNSTATLCEFSGGRINGLSSWEGGESSEEPATLSLAKKVSCKDSA